MKKDKKTQSHSHNSQEPECQLNPQIEILGEAITHTMIFSITLINLNYTTLYRLSQIELILRIGGVVERISQPHTKLGISISNNLLR